MIREGKSSLKSCRVFEDGIPSFLGCFLPILDRQILLREGEYGDIQILSNVTF